MGGQGGPALLGRPPHPTDVLTLSQFNHVVGARETRWTLCDPVPLKGRGVLAPCGAQCRCPGDETSGPPNCDASRTSKGDAQTGLGKLVTDACCHRSA